TDTARRNRISPVLMEALQLLKFALKKERLNFMDGWSTSEEATMPKCASQTLTSHFVGDSEAVLDDMLYEFGTYDVN
ncbi:hypothetical protein EDB85DRAFT_1862173, partial [Lactarius pseudohatsudake]